MADLAQDEVGLAPERVWHMLTDVAAWPQWMPQVKEIVSPVSTLTEGASIEIRAAQARVRVDITVRHVEAPETLSLDWTQSRKARWVAMLAVGTQPKFVRHTFRIESSVSGSRITVESKPVFSKIGMVFGGWLLKAIFQRSLPRSYRKAFVRYAGQASEQTLSEDRPG